MPRRTLKILKACWAALAWVLFLTGVIGCGGSPTQTGADADAAPMTSDASDAGPKGSDASDASDAGPTGSDASDAGPTGSDATDAGPTGSDASDAAEAAPRPTFESYDEVLYIYMGTFPFTAFGELFITAEGDVYAASGRELKRVLIGHATKDELATLVEIATRPQTLAAFARTDTTGCGMFADGYEELSVSIKDMPVYKRHNACPGLTELQDQAHLIRDNVYARNRDAGGN